MVDERPRIDESEDHLAQKRRVDEAVHTFASLGDVTANLKRAHLFSSRDSEVELFLLAFSRDIAGSTLSPFGVCFNWRTHIFAAGITVPEGTFNSVIDAICPPEFAAAVREMDGRFPADENLEYKM